MANVPVFHEQDVDDEEELDDGKEDVVDVQKDGTEFSEFSSSPAEEVTPQQQIQDYAAFFLGDEDNDTNVKRDHRNAFVKNATVRQKSQDPRHTQVLPHPRPILTHWHLFVHPLLHLQLTSDFWYSLFTSASPTISSFPSAVLYSNRNAVAFRFVSKSSFRTS
jgi:hypothetical protein